MANLSKSQGLCDSNEYSHFSCNCCTKTKDDSTKLLSANFHNSNDNKMENVLRVIEKRYGDLSERRQYLIEKIYNIEKTMPLLMVYNASTMSSSPNGLDNLIDVLSPHSEDQSNQQDSNQDNIIDNNEIKDLNDQVNKLYDEIIKTDIELEESITTLESQRAINLELENKLSSMGHKSAEAETLNNLYYIISQDNDNDDDNSNILNCLGKLKAFIQQEIRLKKCINVLEKREQCLHTQLDKLLSNSKDITNSTDKHCTGKICCQRQKKNQNADKSQTNDNDDDDDELDISKYCDCCPMNKNNECNWKD